MKIKFFTLILMVFISFHVSSQNNTIYLVDSKTLNVRSGPGVNFEVLATLTKGQEVMLLNSENTNWWLVEIENKQGFVSSKYLKEDPFATWEKKYYSSGSAPECENINPKFDTSIKNYLKINVGSNTDVVVKLMKKNLMGDDYCIRIAYVRSNEFYKMENIPEGHYYLKIAYGSDYRQKIENGQCKVRFVRNAEYEKGEENLSFYKIPVIGGFDIPSFELTLDMIIVEGQRINEFDSDTISEEEFNK